MRIVAVDAVIYFTMHESRLPPYFAPCNPRILELRGNPRLRLTKLCWAFRGAGVEVDWAAVLCYPMVEDMLKCMQEFSFFPY